MNKLQRARDLGVLHDGWRFVDYELECGPRFGWICAVVWGEKGSGKSATMLQHGYGVFHGFDALEEIGKMKDGTPITRGIITNWEDMEAWKLVLEHTVFRPDDFASLLGRVLKERQRLSWVAWDDVNVHFPRSMYSTNRRTWEEFARNWEAMRANLSVFECSAPLKSKIVSFILADMNFDILISSRQRAEVSRWFWEKDLFEPERVLKFKVDIDADELDVMKIPKEVWGQYWDRKLKLIDEGTLGFEEMLRNMEKKNKPKDGEEPSPKVRAKFPCPHCGRNLGNQYNLDMHEPKCGKA